MRVVVVEDHEMIRQGLCSLLPAVVGAQVIGHASNGRDAVRLLTTLAPDVVLMDITMPGLNGIEATRQITLRDPHLKVIALSSHSDRQTIARFIEAGGAGYIDKTCAVDEVAAALATVTSGRIYISPRLAANA